MLRNKRNEAWFVKRRENLKELVQSIYDESKQIFGASKIRAVLINRGYTISKRFVSELMREMGLYSIRISSKKDNVTLGWNERKTNILKQNFNVDQPNKVWVSDVTCYKFKENYYYICVFIDLFSRKVLSISIGRNNSTHLVRTAFSSA
jgi:putative transposase